jgi:predicted DNA-binding transcriptional regulator YafY
MTTTSSRLLTLLSLLQGRRDWPGEELADRLGVSGRTVRRDIDRLRDLGYPVTALTGPAGGYRLRAGTAMPPLLVDDEEAVVIAVGLRTAAGSSVEGIEETSVRALVKLEQVLPSHLRRRVNALGSATATLPAPGPRVDAGALTVIAGACRDHERVRFHYEARDGARTRREVEPHTLVNLGRRWYLVAFDGAREDWRTFRVDRLERVAATGTRFAPRQLPHQDPARYVADRLSGAMSRHQARVTLHAPITHFDRRRSHVWGTLTPIDDASCEFRASDDDLDSLALRVGILGVEFEVHEPPELRERLAVLAARFARASGGILAPMDLEERTLETVGERCEECGAVLTSGELQAAMERGGPALCAVHASEAVVLDDSELEGPA